MRDSKGKFLCSYGYEKLDAKGKAEFLKLTAWLNEKAQIEKRFKDRASALLCRQCSAKTGYTLKNYRETYVSEDCEMCGDATTYVGLNSSWEQKAHWEGPR